MEQNDTYLQILQQRVEEMEKKDKTGMSFVEMYKPYSDMYNYVMMNIELLKEQDKQKALKLLGWKNQTENEREK